MNPSGRLLAVGVALALVTGCAAAPDHAPLTSLQAMEEVRLFYPGSEVLGSLELPRQRTFEGTQDAQVGHRLGAMADSSDIEAWYASELASRGWTDAVDFRATSETMARGWKKDGIRFRYAVRRKSDPQGATPEQDATYETIYEVRVTEDP